MGDRYKKKRSKKCIHDVGRAYTSHLVKEIYENTALSRKGKCNSSLNNRTVKTPGRVNWDELPEGFLSRVTVLRQHLWHEHTLDYVACAYGVM